MIETRKTEIRYRTSDPERMLGRFIARRALKTWTEDFVDKDTDEIISIERNEILFERGTYIDQDVLSSIRFYLQEGSLTEIEVSNQKRLAMIDTNHSLYPYKAVVKIDDKSKTFLLYATSIANALVILVDYVELNYKGSFVISHIKEMNYCVILVDKLKSTAARKYDLDVAYLKNEISTEEFVNATCDAIQADNNDADDDSDTTNDTTKRFYQIGAHIVLHHDKEGDDEEDHTFIVHTYSAVRANDYREIPSRLSG